MTIYGGERAAKKIGLSPASEPKHEYGTKEITLELVDSLDQAIDHIHEFGSGHTEAIVTGEPSLILCHFSAYKCQILYEHGKDVPTSFHKHQVFGQQNLRGLTGQNQYSQYT